MMMRRLNKRTAGAPAGTDPVQGSGAAGSKSAERQHDDGAQSHPSVVPATGRESIAERAEADTAQRLE